MTNQRRWTWLTLVLAVVLAGCGGGSELPPLGDVSGTVTLDGEPLVGVIVTFKPAEGRPATATTDSSGKYTLQYTGDVSGCKTGPNSVSFEWPLGSQDAKVLSTKYTTASELKEDVASGSNTKDFQLVSEGGKKAKKLVIPD